MQSESRNEEKIPHSLFCPLALPGPLNALSCHLASNLSILSNTHWSLGGLLGTMNKEYERRLVKTVNPSSPSFCTPPKVCHSLVDSPFNKGNHFQSRPTLLSPSSSGQSSLGQFSLGPSLGQSSSGPSLGQSSLGQFYLSPKTKKSPIPPEICSDRFTPIRESPEWEIKFNVIQVSDWEGVRERENEKEKERMSGWFLNSDLFAVLILRTQVDQVQSRRRKKPVTVARTV